MLYTGKVVDIRLAQLSRMAFQFTKSLKIDATLPEALALVYEMVDTLESQGNLNKDGSLKGNVEPGIKRHQALVQLVFSLSRDQVIKKLPERQAPTSQHPNRRVK